MKAPKTHIKWNISKSGKVRPQAITQKTAEKHFKQIAEANKPRMHPNCRSVIINLGE
jgi:hypothetical protein